MKYQGILKRLKCGNPDYLFLPYISAGPCRNGARCIVVFAGATDPEFVCECTPQFTGTTCEVPLTGSPCTSNPCRNGGACEVRDNGQTYFCNCPAGEYSVALLRG